MKIDSTYTLSLWDSIMELRAQGHTTLEIYEAVIECCHEWNHIFSEADRDRWREAYSSED
jgi:hypothetical protein